MTKPYIVVYGTAPNCFSAISFCRRSESYLVRYVLNFPHPTERVEPLPDECARNSVIYWRQYNERGSITPMCVSLTTRRGSCFPPSFRASVAILLPGSRLQV